MTRAPSTLQLRSFASVLAGMIAVSVGAPSVSHAAKPKLLFQDLDAKGVEEAEAAVITTSTCVALGKSARHDVLCGDDLRTMMRFGALSASFQGCDGEDCFKSVSKALNAQIIVSGSVSRLGQGFVLSLSAFDTKKMKSVGRTEVKAPSLEQLQLQIPEAISGLFPKR